MAARSIFTALTRNLRKERNILRPFSSEATKPQIVYEQEPSADQESVDDLKSRIFRVRLPKRSVTNVLQNWVNEGHQISISDLRKITKELRQSQRFKHALELSEWMIAHDEREMVDSDYAVRIDLMTKVFGVDAAERYFESLPPSAKTSETYTSLLHCYAVLKLTEKAEQLYRRIKESNLSLTALTYNELMTLYMSVGQVEKVSTVVEDLKCQNVAPDLFTYNLWVSAHAAALKIDEVRRILDEMSHDPSFNDDWARYVKLAKIYLSSGNFVNSETNSLVESEKGITQREWITYDFLIILYGGLGNKDKLDQIWKSLRMTKQKMTSRNYLCILSSYLMLGNLKEVEEVIDQWKLSATTEFHDSTCRSLSKAFAELGLQDKAAAFSMLLTEECETMDEPQ
ncbi:Pentatricopeptide repeat-containing protein [Heracleum sosnowskyi]|uniref:Pentatricopeptide repeat-containing protein n=1 Tax=Heracleum sosnowskyi TaxID=360622 RepID=A0AAD8JG01_9APIA|nr:Pentatricopeptide repeat-containing protein [Heracleum sosnowskyi]